MQKEEALMKKLIACALALAMALTMLTGAALSEGGRPGTPLP